MSYRTHKITIFRYNIVCFKYQDILTLFFFFLPFSFHFSSFLSCGFIHRAINMPYSCLLFTNGGEIRFPFFLIFLQP